MILYKFTFENGKSYIGITSTTLKRRLSLHRSHAKKEVRGHLQRAIRKYGFDSITIEVLAICENWKQLCELEKSTIAKLNTLYPNGYNLTTGGEGILGIKQSPEQIKKRLATLGCRKGILTGRPAGWKHSEEARLKISEAGKGCVFSEERRTKIGVKKRGHSFNVGKVCTPETRAKISAAQKGKPRFSEEQKLRLSAAKKGRPWTEAQRVSYEKRTRNG